MRQQFNTLGIEQFLTSWFCRTVIMTVAQPDDFIANVFNPTPLSDEKYFLRQQKLQMVWSTPDALPIMIRATYFFVRKNIAISEFSSLDSILIASSPDISTGFTLPTTSNTAQKYIKFGKTKIFHLDRSRNRVITLRTPKYSSKKITREIEGNPNLLATPLTRGIIFQVYGSPVHNRAANTASGFYPLSSNPITGIGWSGYSCSLITNLYTSFYQIGINDPSSTFSNSASFSGIQQGPYSDRVVHSDLVR